MSIDSHSNLDRLAWATAAATPAADLAQSSPGKPLGPERTMEQILVRELRQLIVEGKLAPGERLRYRDFADLFGVSITPVRVAIRELAKEGLVETRAHEGARVSLLSAEDLEELFATRIGVESWLARLGAQRITDDALAAAAPLQAEAARAVAEGDREALLASAWAYRTACYKAADRPHLLAIAQSLFERAARYHRLTLDVTQRLEESLEFLEQFACACRARDGRKAATAVIATLERAAEYILESRPTRVDDTPARHTPPLIT